MDAKTRAKFDLEFPKAFKRVLAEAVSLIWRTRWRRPTRETVQPLAEDLVNEAVIRLLGGDRHWDPERVPDVHYFLAKEMRSIVSAEASKRERAPRHVPIENRPAEGRPLAEKLAADVEDPEQALGGGDDDEVDRRVNEVLDTAAGDSLLERVVDAILNGCSKPAAVAQQAGLDVGQVYEAIRKLRRRVASAGRKERP